MAYTVFKRTWWAKEGGKWVPRAGRKTVIRRGLTVEEARSMCERLNRDLPASNRRGMKYEFMSE